jgi:acetyl-CoA carboxylase carboxyl transferase subunit beta
MQESVLSLMQMAKTSCAVARLNEAGILYITILTDPTYGGVTASFGTLGDIIIAEQGARVGFAGRRVIEQTIRQKLPADFQTAEYMMKHGQIDVISARTDLKGTLGKILRLHKTSESSSVAEKTGSDSANGTDIVSEDTEVNVN